METGIRDVRIANRKPRKHSASALRRAAELHKKIAENYAKNFALEIKIKKVKKGSAAAKKKQNVIVKKLEKAPSCKKAERNASASNSFSCSFLKFIFHTVLYAMVG